MRDHYLIHCVSAGQGVFVCGATERLLRQGDLFLIEPGQLVSYRADPLTPWVYSWVGFNGTDARRLVTLAGFSEQKTVIHSSEPEETIRRLRRIADVSGNTAAADAEMVGELLLFLAHLIRMNTDRTADPRHQSYVSNALRFIQYKYAYDIGVNDIARYVGISRSQLYRAFLQDFGISPHVYLQRYRINEACSLLRAAALSVAEVAGSVGFNDPLYFSRVFRAVKGCTPSQYRQQNM